MKLLSFGKYILGKLRIRFSPLLSGLVFASIFSVVFFAIGVNTNFMPLKFPATLPFLIKDQTKTIQNEGTIFDDNSVVDDTPLPESDSYDHVLISGQRLQKLDQAIRDAGIPIDGIALISTKTHETRIDFRPETTEEQKLTARQMADSFDWTLTYKDIFDSQKAKQAIMEKYDPEKLALFSSYISMINYYLDKKDFSKLKSFMNSLYSQNAISEDDYMVMVHILEDQKIYLNPRFQTAPVIPSQTPPPPADIVDTVTPGDAPVISGPIVAPQPIQVTPEPTPEATPEPTQVVPEPTIEVAPELTPALEPAPEVAPEPDMAPAPEAVSPTQ